MLCLIVLFKILIQIYKIINYISALFTNKINHNKNICFYEIYFEQDEWLNTSKKSITTTGVEKNLWMWLDNDLGPGLSYTKSGYQNFWKTNRNQKLTANTGLSDLVN
jgi:hypothetical protein